MPPRINILATRTLLRQQHRPSQQTQSAATWWRNTRTESATNIHLATRPQRQLFSSKSDPQKQTPEQVDEPKGPTQDSLPDVSHEAAAMDRILSGKKCDGNAPGSPELEQGTPIDEILRRDKDALKYAPKVLRDQAKKASGSRSYSTSARLGQEVQNSADSIEDPSVLAVADMITLATEDAIDRNPGMKFDTPAPLSKSDHFKRRYDPVVEQFTKLLMEDGKLSLAQKNMEVILNHLRTSPPPKIDPRRRLLTTLPAPQLPLNPILYLNLLVDSVSPLIKIRQQKGLAGGGASVPMPVPLSMRQRRRTAIKWILDSADKRKDTDWAMRVANELMAVAEGRSGVWEKREQVHKVGISGRTNLQLKPPGSR